MKYSDQQIIITVHVRLQKLLSVSVGVSAGYHSVLNLSLTSLKP